MACVEIDVKHSQNCRTDWPVEVCLLGSFRLLKAGRPVQARGGSKTEALLASLALGWKDGVRREMLLCSLWPESDTPLASQSLHSLVYSLHTLLGDEIGGAAPVVNCGGTYRLNAGAGVGVDLANFEALALLGDRQRRADDQLSASVSYEEAIALYRGDLCGGSDLAAIVERERLRGMYLTLMARLADFYQQRGDPGAALAHALRLLQCDPCREDAHRRAMQSYVRLGERAQALRQYRLCERVLRAEFDIAPEPATQALFDEVRLVPEQV
jgi:DNA-binding SARP family transcriptional activator